MRWLALRFVVFLLWEAVDWMRVGAFLRDKVIPMYHVPNKRRVSFRRSL